MQVELLDSTLREGAQAEGISFSLADKIAVSRVLSVIGIKYIEAGNPYSNPKDREFFDKARSMDFGGSRLVAFSSTHSVDSSVEEDPSIEAILSSGAETAVIFGKTHLLHAEKVLGISKEQNLKLIYETINKLTENKIEVIFDAEHFFDGYFYDKEYSVNCLETAEKAGAAVLCLCDSNGGTDPEDIKRITADIVSRFPERIIGIHAHNDSDCAVAASIAAVNAGARHVQGSFNGYGERCGIARLSSVIAGLQIKRNIKCIEGDPKELTTAAIKIAEIANMALAKNTPFVGSSAFSHKAGMHVDAMDKLDGAFEHINPTEVGNKRKMLLSEISGKKSVSKKLGSMFPGMDIGSNDLENITNSLKEKENEGYQYEGADASFYLLASKILKTYRSHFEPVHYRTSGEFPSFSDSTASAFVQIKVGDKQETGASLGNGPVNALDGALRKALTVFYPSLSGMRLIDYKVRVLSSKEATGATVRVLITSTGGENVWTTVGVSPDIIKASFTALSDSIEYYFNKGAKS